MTVLIIIVLISYNVLYQVITCYNSFPLDYNGIVCYHAIVKGKLVNLHSDTIEKLEQYRTYPRQSYNELLQAVFAELDRYKNSYKRPRDNKSRFIKDNG